MEHTCVHNNPSTEICLHDIENVSECFVLLNEILSSKTVYFSTDIITFLSKN